MQLIDLKPAVGSTHRRKIVGRGHGSGHGKTSCRGANGQGQRSGSEFKKGFEGGQMPLFRRTPKKKHFKVISRIEYSIINVDRLQKRLEANTDLTPKLMLEKGLISDPDKLIKILGDGTISIPLTIHAHAFTPTAKEKIEAAGGTVVILETTKIKKTEENKAN